MAQYRMTRATFAWQARPSFATTLLPHWQVCVSHRLRPNRNPTATLIASLLSQSPHTLVGKRQNANHCICSAVTAKSLALSILLVAPAGTDRQSEMRLASLKLVDYSLNLEGRIWWMYGRPFDNDGCDLLIWQWVDRWQDQIVEIHRAHSRCQKGRNY